MIKRVNSTGRRRIAGSRVTIAVHDATPRTFEARIDLQDFAAPADAAVILEATCAGSNTILRFECGPLGTLGAPVTGELRDLHGKHVFFSLKVIDRSERFGRILGVAHNIRPLQGGNQTAVGRRGILPIEAQELGAALWKLEFRNEDVFLLVNQTIPGLADRMRYDPTVYALIYPAIIREILRRALSETAGDEGDDDGADDRWPQLWLRFAQRLHPERLASPPDDDGDEQDEWIEAVAEAFCREHDLRESFLRAMPNAGAGDGP
ncbi:MAG: hypothetical protein JSS02_33595 [Planctomycetes bacterium]|nr:hypothetical protein [Planctomycetota bacterium]